MKLNDLYGISAAEDKVMGAVLRLYDDTKKTKRVILMKKLIPLHFLLTCIQENMVNLQ